MEAESNSKQYVPQSVPHFKISEEDLVELERTLPQLSLAMMPLLDNRLRTKLRQVQKILSDVRWGYGPASNVGTVSGD